MIAFKEMAIKNLDEFIFGTAPKPLTLKNGMVIGGGTVYPELNFTLPGMKINENSMPDVLEQYRQMIESACKRAGELSSRGLVVEFELLPDLTLYPEWGAEVARLLKETLENFSSKTGIPSALRVTPNDVREFAKPPLMRSGEYAARMYESIERCAEAGADLIAIESTGGKEFHDDAILQGDLFQSVFALSILGARDMRVLWSRISEICGKHDAIPSGDTACGFANTAMVLAEQGFIPRVWAALLRVIAVPRSLIAFEQGAVGPGKDCAYEGPYTKAITGYPISLEGAESACAHLSPIGNITKAVPDLWSNESVQNVKLLSAMAPTVSLEQLIYAARLMNQAKEKGKETALVLRDLFVESDDSFDPQAYMLRPDLVLRISREIITEPTPFLRTRKAVLSALHELREGFKNEKFSLSRAEVRWLDRLSKQAVQLPEDEDRFISEMLTVIPEGKVALSEYDL